MTVYARSDIAGVSISQAHGGCGESHSRPVVQGAPVQVWALECHGGCEDVLRGDPLWASELAMIPETHDEAQVRKQQEMLGQRDAATATATALQKLASLGDLPTAIHHLTNVMTGNTAAAPAPTVIDCPNGHAVGVSSKFCPECGSPMVADPIPTEPKPDPAPAPEVPVKTDPASGVGQPTTQGGGGDDDVDFGAMTVAELNTYARNNGIKVVRTKADQIELINEHLADQ